MLVVRVLPDVPAIDKTFDYLVPPELVDSVPVGTMVRISLSGRRVGGWVVATDVEPLPGVKLAPLAKMTGRGPAPELIELARWAAWRWAGRAATFLRTASPPGVVRGLPPARPAEATSRAPLDPAVAELAADALARPRAVLRLAPTIDPFDVVLAAAARGDALVLFPALDRARHALLRLQRAGVEATLVAGDRQASAGAAGWARASSGGVVLGARATAWAPVAGLAAVVVIDEHDEAYQEERAPTWHARDVVAERARRHGVPCVLVSPCPSLEALRWGPLVAGSRTAERAGWPVLDVVDRRREDPTRGGLWSDRLVRVLRSEARVLCVLNRVGRSRLLACATCGELARCERCGAAVAQEGDGALSCRGCGAVRPAVCPACGATRLKNLRMGVTRAREELEALIGEPVVEVTTATAGSALAPARVHVGTEAVLHQLTDADVVAFLDFDQELLAPRYRAAEQALALLARAARLVGGRGRDRHGGRLLVQTRLPLHQVLEAVLHADPARVSDAEAPLRAAMRFPPAAALAVVSGAAAPAFVEAFGQPAGVEVLGPTDGAWLLRADGHRTLSDALAATRRPPGRLRVEVDPLRI